jgi:hypothetical protein
MVAVKRDAEVRIKFHRYLLRKERETAVPAGSKVPRAAER